MALPRFYQHVALPASRVGRSLAEVFQGGLLRKAERFFNTPGARMAIPSPDPQTIRRGHLTLYKEAPPVPEWASSNPLPGSDVGPVEVLEFPNSEYALRRGPHVFSSLAPDGDVSVVETSGSGTDIMLDHGNFILSNANLGRSSPDAPLTRMGYAIDDIEDAIWDGGISTAMINFLDHRYDIKPWHGKRDQEMLASSPLPDDMNFSITPGMMQKIIAGMNMDYVSSPYLIDYGQMAYDHMLGNTPFKVTSDSKFRSLDRRISYQSGTGPQDVDFADVPIARAMRQFTNEGILHMIAPGQFSEGGRNPGAIRSVAFQNGKQIVNHPEEMITDDPGLYEKHGRAIGDALVFSNVTQPYWAMPRVLGVMRETDPNAVGKDKKDGGDG